MTIPTAENATVAERDATQRPRLATLYQAATALPLLFVLLLFIGYFAILLVYSGALLRFPFDYDQGEGFELYDAVRLARGLNIYLDNSVFPFYSSNYPPVYRVMLVPLVWLFGPQIWVGRAVSLGGTLVIAVLIFWAARRQMADSGVVPSYRFGPLSFQALASLIAALAFLAANYVYEIAPLARAHLLMVMFAFAGICCLDRALTPTVAPPGSQPGNRDGSQATRFTIAGVVLLLIAGLTKLQAVDALVAGFGFLLIRRPRWCLAAIGLSLIAVGALVILLNWSTAGQFWLNVVLANVNEYDIQRTWFFYGQWFQLQGALIVCSVAYVLWDIVRAIRARSLAQVTIWSLYFCTGSAMGMLTGKWGAGPTYLIAAIAASCVCSAGLLWRIARLDFWRQSFPRALGSIHASTSVLALLTSIVFLVQAVLNVHLPTSGRLLGAIARIVGRAGQSSYPPYPYYDSVGYTQLGHLLDTADAQNGWELASIVGEAKGPVWSEEAMLALRAGKDVVTNPTQLLNLSKSGMLDTSKMIELIKTKAFGAVVFRAQFYPQDVLIAIGQNYHWVRAVRMNGFDYQVLYPNNGLAANGK